MRLEAINKRPLEEDEILLKRHYTGNGGDLWRKPMTFPEYEELISRNELVLTPLSHYYKEKTIDGFGTTIIPAHSKEHIEIVAHRRYSYPILHKHDYVEIIYVAEGCCTNFLDSIAMKMNAGDVCIMSPNSFHALSCTNDESTIINIIVNRDFFNHAFLEILRSGNILSSFLESVLYFNPVNPYILFRTGQDDWLRLLAQHMYTEAVRKPHAFDYSIRLLVSEFILHLVREYEVTAIVPDHKTNAPDDTIVAILGYLSVNYHRTTLSDVAAFFGYTPAYLSRKIRKSTGKTFNDIILDLQMGAAARMIKSGETNLTNIANEIGCFDSSHFSRKFKKYYGCSPRKYMEKNNN